MTCNVTFIGLGVMGYPMAGYISKAGHNVTVYNRTASKADKWLSEFTRVTKAEYSFKSCGWTQTTYLHVLGMTMILREVTFGENGIFKTIKKDSYLY